MDKNIQIENQILRIKELINENRLYGKLVDQEFLNEGNPIKGVVVDALEFLKKFNVPLTKIDAVTKATLKTDMDNILTSFNNNITIGNIESKLNPNSSENIFDILKQQTKNKLGAVKVKGTVLDSSGNLVELTPLLTKEVEKSIDEFFDTVKLLDLDKFNKKWDDLPGTTKEILDTLPNIKANYVVKYTKKILNRLKPIVVDGIKALWQPLKIRKNIPDAWETLFRSTGNKYKVIEAFKRIVNAQKDLISKEALISWICVTFAKDAIKAFLVCDEYEEPKIEFAGDKKNGIEFAGDKKNGIEFAGDKKNGTTEIKEQEKEKEKTTTGAQKEGFEFGGELVGQIILELVFPKYRLDPLTTVSKIFESLGWDGLKGMGLLGEDSWSCPTSEQHKNFIDALKETGVPVEKIDDAKKNVVEHFGKTTEMVKEIIDVELEKNGITEKDLKMVLQSEN